MAARLLLMMRYMMCAVLSSDLVRLDTSKATISEPALTADMSLIADLGRRRGALATHKLRYQGASE